MISGVRLAADLSLTISPSSRILFDAVAARHVRIGVSGAGIAGDFDEADLDGTANG